jgi:hypothetical protein
MRWNRLMSAWSVLGLALAAPGAVAEVVWKDYNQHCDASGTRTYSYRLWGLPIIGGDWKKSCSETALTLPNGARYTPKRSECIDKGAGGLYYERKLARDPICYGAWGEWTRKECVAVGAAVYHSRLWQIRDATDWMTACRAVPAKVPGVAGALTLAVRQCRDKRVGGMWGEVVTRDTGCTVKDLKSDSARRALFVETLEKIRPAILAQQRAARSARTGASGQAIGADLAAYAEELRKARTRADVETILRKFNAGRSRDAAPLSAAGDEPGEVAGYPIKVRTLGFVVDASAILGANMEVGRAYGPRGLLFSVAYATFGVSYGVSAGADVGAVSGTWIVDIDRLSGDSWGAVVAGGVGPDLGIGLWFTYDNEFIGWTTSGSVGVSKELGEINRVFTLVAY